MDKMYEKLDKSFIEMFMLEIQIKNLIVTHATTKARQWFDSIKYWRSALKAATAEFKKAERDCARGDTVDDLKRLRDVWNSVADAKEEAEKANGSHCDWLGRLVNDDLTVDKHNYRDRKQRSDEAAKFAALIREKIASLAQNAGNFRRDCENFLLKNQRFDEWKEFCVKFMNERLDQFFDANKTVGEVVTAEEKEATRVSRDDVIADAKQIHATIKSFHQEMTKKISYAMKHKVPRCDPHRNMTQLPDGEDGHRCADCVRAGETTIAELSTARKRTEIELLLFLKKAQEKLPWIKRALWFVEHASGRVEVEPLFEAIDAATAKFADALSIIEKPRPNVIFELSHRLRYCSSSVCTKRESAPGTFRCCFQCQADHIPPRNFYCSEDCFLDDWKLVHYRCHDARKKEGIGEVTKRGSLLQECAQVKEEDDDEGAAADQVFLVGDDLDSEDDSIGVGENLQSQGRRCCCRRHSQLRRRRRNCSAFDCKRKENGTNGENENHQHEDAAAPFLCCEQCRRDGISPRAFYCSQDCYAKDWLAVHRRFHKVRRRKLRGDSIDKAGHRKVENLIEEDDECSVYEVE